MSYSAVLLDEESQQALKDWALERWEEGGKPKYNVAINSVGLPIHVRDNGWNIQDYCHHMTINMGALPEHLKSYLGSEQKLESFAVGISDKAVAVRVMGIMAGHSKNDIPHITIAIGNGGKPVDSNKITNWIRLDKSIKLSGVVKELQ